MKRDPLNDDPYYSFLTGLSETQRHLLREVEHRYHWDALSAYYWIDPNSFRAHWAVQILEHLCHEHDLKFKSGHPLTRYFEIVQLTHEFVYRLCIGCPQDRGFVEAAPKLAKRYCDNESRSRLPIGLTKTKINDLKTIYGCNNLS